MTPSKSPSMTNDDSQVQATERKQSLIVFLDTGTQRFFLPLIRMAGAEGTPPDAPQSLLDALRTVDDYWDAHILSDETRAVLEKLSGKSPNTRIPFAHAKTEPWFRYRFGKRTWKLKNGMDFDLYGIWVLVETNTADGRGEGGEAAVFDRGYFYQKDDLTEQEKQIAIENAQANRSNERGTSFYLTQKKGSDFRLNFDTNFEFDDEPEPRWVSFEKILFELVVRQPASVPFDVDIVLDLGNTRTSGLFFEHTQKQGFSPELFASKFKAIRLLPDPFSGEYDAPPKVSDGIADSWFVLHELEHQEFKHPEDSKEPELLQSAWTDIQVRTRTEGFLFKKTLWEVASGCVIKRIPQMFTQLSPVLIGNAAKRQFDWEYTRMLVELGLNLQQSSPKRYYWDNEPVENYWCLILNEWDKYNDGDPRDDKIPPLLQGEMLRFIHEKGELLDLSNLENTDPSQRPGAFPDSPAYPRQSTLTWFILHILERAFAQTNNGTFAGNNFTPRRLRNVLITYPSGWTAAEVARYRARCKEALDIFSETHVYHGTKNTEMRLRMVPLENSPDEAVAGQLPFVFSEILRYPGQSANDWISNVGKIRGDDPQAGVRVMNFDIGGGTTDISIIEYHDRNGTSMAAQNILSTELLFKDGQALAGDDLLKRVIEDIVLSQLISGNMGNVLPDGTKIGDVIATKFSNPPQSNKEEALRSRIVRTCLIPLGIHCYTHAGQELPDFSVADAGVSEANWSELKSFLELPPEALPREATRFHFDAEDLAKLVEKTFTPLLRNCALYASAYDVDLVVFSGKTTELPSIRAMAERILPLEAERIIFARSFQPGTWYPFLDEKGYIADAKTVTVVGAALYYALSSGFISGWTIRSNDSCREVRNDWGEYKAMTSVRKSVFLSRNEDEKEIELLPNAIIARRQNICSSPEAVYKLVSKTGNYPSSLVTATFRRVSAPGGESLELVSAMVDGKETKDYELRLWPCADEVGFRFWQDTGTFDSIG